MYESNPRVPIPLWATPGDLTRIKSWVGGNLTFVQVPVPRAFDTRKKRRSYLKKSYKVDSVVHTDVTVGTRHIFRFASDWLVLLLNCIFFKNNGILTELFVNQKVTYNFRNHRR